MPELQAGSSPRKRPLILKPWSSIVLGVLGTVLSLAVPSVLHSIQGTPIDTHIEAAIYVFALTVAATLTLELWKRAYIAVEDIHGDTVEQLHAARDSYMANDARRRQQLVRAVNAFEKLSIAAGLLNEIETKQKRLGLFNHYAMREAEALNAALQLILNGKYSLFIHKPSKAAGLLFEPLGDTLARGGTWRTVTRLDFWSSLNMGENDPFKHQQVQAIRHGGVIERIVLLPRGSVSQLDEREDLKRVLDDILTIHIKVWEESKSSGGSSKLLFLESNDSNLSDERTDRVANFAVLTGAAAEDAPKSAVRMLYPAGSFASKSLVPFQNVFVTEDEAGDQDWQWSVETCENRYEALANGSTGWFRSVNDCIRAYYPEMPNEFWLETLFAPLEPEGVRAPFSTSEPRARHSKDPVEES